MFRYNPFRPNNMVGPGMFVGRVDEMDTIEKCLFQATHGNPQHFLIEGERGIGKSSLLFLAEHVAKGTVKAKDASRMSFLTISVDMGGVESQLDVVRAIARQLKTTLDEKEKLKAAAHSVWDFLSKWEIMGVRYHGNNSAEVDDARDELVNRIVELMNLAQEEFKGVFVIIDEADAPPEEAGLGAFLKLFTERLAKRGCEQVVLGLAGLPSTIPMLRASHASAPRLLEVLRLDPLSPDERKAVVERGLAEAKTKNNVETKITTEAINLISVLSEGYPHFIQQFAYFAFDEDTDNVIDVQDVRNGAYKENGALMQLGHKYFSEMYHAKIASEEYRNVLGAMAAFGDSWIARKDLINASEVSEANVNNALAALKVRKIIQSDDTRRGYYRLPTKSFAAWINAIRANEAKKLGTGLADLFGSTDPGT